MFEKADSASAQPFGDQLVPRRTCSTTKNLPVGLGVLSAPTTTVIRLTTRQLCRTTSCLLARSTRIDQSSGTSLPALAGTQPVEPFGRIPRLTRIQLPLSVVRWPIPGSTICRPVSGVSAGTLATAFASADGDCLAIVSVVKAIPCVGVGGSAEAAVGSASAIAAITMIDSWGSRVVRTATLCLKTSNSGAVRKADLF